MKKSIMLLFGILFMFSCGQDNYWNEQNKADFKNGCENSLNKSIAQAGNNLMEQLGTSVEALCDCQLEKTMEEFPKGPAEKSEMMQSVTKNSKDCLTELTDM